MATEARIATGLLGVVAVIFALSLGSPATRTVEAANPAAGSAYAGLQLTPTGENPLIHWAFRMRSDGVVESRRIEIGQVPIWLEVDWTPVRSIGGNPPK